MRFRKLRIAWSVLCAIACVVLIVLWVRSYSRLDEKMDGEIASLSLPAEFDQLDIRPKRLLLGRLINAGEYSTAIELLNRSNVDIQVEHATKRNHLYWAGVQAIAVDVPGVEQTSNMSVWVLPGTSCTPESKEWQIAASQFAERYNRALAAKIQGREQAEKIDR